MGYKIL